MRVYIPLTPSDVSAEQISRPRAWGDTPSLRASFGEETWGSEEYEAQAMELAAEACLDLLDGDDLTCRIVAAADVDGELRPGSAPGEVALDAPVSWTQVVSLHLDEEETWPSIRAFVEGEIDDIEDASLLWYDVTELRLVREIVEGAQQ